jgi:hypothetical protein
MLPQRIVGVECAAVDFDLHSGGTIVDSDILVTIAFLVTRNHSSLYDNALGKSVVGEAHRQWVEFQQLGDGMSGFAVVSGNGSHIQFATAGGEQKQDRCHQHNNVGFIYSFHDIVFSDWMKLNR